MYDPLEIKSTAELIDLMYTAEMKAKLGNTDASERRHKLGNIVMGRMNILMNDMPKHREFQALMLELRDVLQQCWDAQEVVSLLRIEDERGLILGNIHTIAFAGKRAQETNAVRNRLIRQLDELVGESERTQLAKSYDKDNYK